MVSPLAARPLHETAFHRLLDHGSYLELTRSGERYPAPESIDQEYRALLAIEERFQDSGRGLLVDLRGARGRNDPEFEAAIARWRRPSLAGFRPLVVLVRSALGQLHVQRHMAADGLDALVLLDEAEARAAFRPSRI